jgi:hypothetical protein
MTGTKRMPQHPVRARRITSASPLPSSSLPLPANGALVGGGNAAGGGLSPFFFFGVAALFALAVGVVPGVIWTLAATTRLAPPRPFVSLRERPG